MDITLFDCGTGLHLALSVEEISSMILIVDDNREIRELLVDCLIEEGDKVCYAEDGSAALRLLWTLELLPLIDQFVAAA